MARQKKTDDKPIAPAVQQHPGQQQMAQQQQQVFQPQVQQQMQQQPNAGPSPMAMAPPTSGTPFGANNSNRAIDVNNFIRVRDSWYQRLLTLQNMISGAAEQYLQQTNMLLGEPTFAVGGEIPQGQDFGNMLQMQPGAVFPNPGVPAVEEKKERKKRQHDPNAPKRPLTPYFLYMQTARPIIAVDLGDGVPKGAVQEEGQRRWKDMSDQEKLGWNQAYQYNLRLYNARVLSYKAGNANAKEMTDDEAVRYCEEFDVPMPKVVGVESEAAVVDGSVAPQQLLAPAPVAPIQPEPAAKPAAKLKASRKRKSEAIEPAQPTPVAAPVSATPDKKPRKRAAPKPVEQPEKEEPKKSGRKKAKSG